MRILGTDPLIYIGLVVGLLITLAVGFVTEQKTMMPVLNALIVWPLLIWALRHARIDIALRLVVIWAVVIFVGSVVAGRTLGQIAQAAVPGSIEFNAEHMRWLTGNITGVEQPANWLPDLGRRSGVLLAGSALSAGLIPLIAGARYLAILGLWTANLFDAPSLLAIPLGIPPWIWAETVAQISLGVLLAEPMVSGDAQALITKNRRRLLFTGLIALALALLLQLLLPSLIESPLRSLIS